MKNTSTAFISLRRGCIWIYRWYLFQAVPTSVVKATVLTIMIVFVAVIMLA